MSDEGDLSDEQDRGGPGPGPRSTARTIVFVCLYLVFLVALLEGASYAVLTVWDNELGDASERHRYNPVRGHELNPVYRREFDTAGREIHSAQGFRRDELVSVRKPAGTFRILMLGGSTMYGIGVQGGPHYPLHRTLANDETISHFVEAGLERLVSKHGIGALNVEVINAGVTAYHTFQHVLYLYESLYEYEPDLVLFVDGHNDFYSLDTSSPIRRYGYSSHNLVRALNERQPFIGLYAAFRSLGDVSHFFKVMEKVAFKLFERYEGKPHNIAAGPKREGGFATEYKAAASIGFLRNYALSHQLGKLHGFELHVFLQPEIVFEDPQLLVPADRAIRTTTQTLNGGPDGAQFMSKARQQLPVLFADAGIAFTDIGQIARRGKPEAQLYIDYCHLTPAGAARVAEHIVPVAWDYLRRMHTR
ncbi:MAG: hypothetical protein AAF458_07365 [Pseudomonadota bacterium]